MCKVLHDSNIDGTGIHWSKTQGPLAFLWDPLWVNPPWCQEMLRTWSAAGYLSGQLPREAPCHTDASGWRTGQMSGEKEPKGDGGVLSDGRGTKDNSSSVLVEVPLLEAKYAKRPGRPFQFSWWPQVSVTYRSNFQARSPQPVALPRSVFWGCGASQCHNLQEELQGRAAPAV